MKWRLWLVVGALGLTGLVGSAGAQVRAEEVGLARMRDATGKALGKVFFRDAGKGVLVEVELSGVAAGFHGFHVHTTGNCTPPSFTSAGGHFNPTGASHGAHAGDLPTLYVGYGGRANMTFRIDRFGLRALFDADGSALVIHQAADNYANIPTRYSSPSGPGPDAETRATGDSGARIACGVIKRQVQRVKP